MAGVECVELVYAETFSAYPDDGWDPGEWEAPAGITPLLVDQQGYLGPAPARVDASRRAARCASSPSMRAGANASSSTM